MQNYIAFLRCGKGMTFKQIAGHLNRSLKAIEWHWGRYTKRAGTSDPLQVLKRMIVKGEVRLNSSS